MLFHNGKGIDSLRVYSYKHLEADLQKVEKVKHKDQDTVVQS